jgi:hypothetical protein
MKMAAFQHFAEHPISVVVAFISPLRVLIVDPHQYDDFAGCVIAKEQSVLLEKFGTEPMLVVSSVRISAHRGRHFRLIVDAVSA